MFKYASTWLLIASILIALIPAGMGLAGKIAASVAGCHISVSSIDYAPPIKPGDCPRGGWINVWGGSSSLFFFFTIPAGILIFIASVVLAMMESNTRRTRLK